MQDCGCEYCKPLQVLFDKNPAGNVQQCMFTQLAHHPEMIPLRLCANMGADMARNHFRQLVKYVLLYEHAALTHDTNYYFSLFRNMHVIWKEFKDQNLIAKCTVCSKDTTVCCSNCKITAYCNPTCQVKHWNDYHKFICKNIKKFVNEMEALDSCEMD